MRAAIISTIAAFAIGALAAWSYQGNRYDARISKMERDNAVILAEAHRRAKEDYDALERVKNDAIKEYQSEAAKHKAAADNLRSDVDRLQRNLSRVPGRIEQATRAAVNEFAATNAQLLGACTKEYEWMAGEAQRNAANARLMFNAWPRRE